eukprot:CAMPEP_0171290550 /NCGR_PEP_ID=MMETSP0790-20130122/71205_1 /TAXON_ID=2925 /ORGANISM="Alexandrium catenella, Strain OF101" /LENGTH=154 /DNA_ID=CAMNT_0011760267 /DNA_START=150 /DNA_END=611 /DNA_ORIENTATION=+
MVSKSPLLSRIRLNGFSMLVVLLHHAFHGTHTAVAQHQAVHLCLIFLRPVHAQVELAPLPKRKRQDADVLVQALEERLVVGVPAHRLAAVLIEVDVATVWPLARLAQTAVRHVDCHDLVHPVRENLRLHLDAPVAVAARAPRLDHPCGLAWDDA